MSLPAFLFDRNFRIDSPVEAFAFLVAFDESIVLAEVVAHTRLPTAGGSLELVPRIFLLDIVVDLLEVHLAGAGGGDRFVNQHNIIRRRSLQLLLRVVFDAHLR